MYVLNLQLTPGNGAFGPPGYWSNKDMDPVPPKERTWSSWNFIAYWISDAANPAMWQLASSMLAVGLTWRQALAAIAAAHYRHGPKWDHWRTSSCLLPYHQPLLFWLLAQLFQRHQQSRPRHVLTYSGSECMYQMLKAIWPSTARIPNRLPASSPVSTQGMPWQSSSSSSHIIPTIGIMCYFLFWFLQLPLLLIPPQKIRHFFTAKSIIVPCAWLAILIWAMVRVLSSISLAPVKGPLTPVTISGSKLAWAWLNALNSSLGVYATLAINIPDFTRYAKNERAQFVQIFIIPTAFTLVGFVGIAVTSAAESIYHEILWDPLRLIDKWTNRPAAFFASLSFLMSIIGTNISANSISAANDLMALCPKYINMRRGQVICALVGGWALCPWEILATAPGFLSFMSGYTVFLGPFAGM
ncbi:hypothetical protein C0991_007463 [Blastosporella zonata]|nr:hypothetical protein C0991_007463 [Blastosporella zonata]